MSKNVNFLDLIEKQREKKTKEKFNETFLEYLQVIKENNDDVKLSHKRLYESIIDRGVSVLSESDSRCQKLFNGDQIKTYDYFSSHFFGMRVRGF